MNLTVLGPNLPSSLARQGSFHVHTTGCRDIRRRYRGQERDLINVQSELDVMKLIYPPHDFQYNPDHPEQRRQYLNDIYFAPCIKWEEGA